MLVLLHVLHLASIWTCVEGKVSTRMVWSLQYITSSIHRRVRAREGAAPINHQSPPTRTTPTKHTHTHTHTFHPPGAHGCVCVEKARDIKRLQAPQPEKYPMRVQVGIHSMPMDFLTLIIYKGTTSSVVPRCQNGPQELPSATMVSQNVKMEALSEPP